MTRIFMDMSYKTKCEGIIKIHSHFVLLFIMKIFETSLINDNVLFVMYKDRLSLCNMPFALFS